MVTIRLGGVLLGVAFSGIGVERGGGNTGRSGANLLGVVVFTF